MSGIAEVLLTLGYDVSGSDLVDGETTRRLARLGARIDIGPHDAARITEDIDVLVISSAVTFANPEASRARELKIPVVPRAEMLAELMRKKYGVAVAGTHGKTTTTSLVAAVLREAGRDPTVVVGGKLRTLGTNARLGQGEFLVAEADESDGTFLLLSPIIAVVTNIDREHLDYYGEMERLRDAYLQFIHRVPFYGLAVLCIDNVNVRALQPHRYTRTRDLFNEFLEAFDDADTLVLTDIYPAGEERIEGVSAEVVYQALRRRGHLDVCHVPARERVAEALAELVRPGDLVLTLGAGDIHRTGDELLDLLRSGVAVPAIH